MYLLRIGAFIFTFILFNNGTTANATALCPTATDSLSSACAKGERLAEGLNLSKLKDEKITQLALQTVCKKEFKSEILERGCFENAFKRLGQTLTHCDFSDYKQTKFDHFNWSLISPSPLVKQFINTCNLAKTKADNLDYSKIDLKTEAIEKLNSLFKSEAQDNYLLRQSFENKFKSSINTLTQLDGKFPLERNYTANPKVAPFHQKTWFDAWECSEPTLKETKGSGLDEVEHEIHICKLKLSLTHRNYNLRFSKKVESFKYKDTTKNTELEQQQGLNSLDLKEGAHFSLEGLDAKFRFGEIRLHIDRLEFLKQGKMQFEILTTLDRNTGAGAGSVRDSNGAITSDLDTFIKTNYYKTLLQ